MTGCTIPRKGRPADPPLNPMSEFAEPARVAYDVLVKLGTIALVK
jgi:hypothetical protein